MLQAIDAHHQAQDQQPADYRRWWCDQCQATTTQPYNLHFDLCHTARDYAYCCHLCESRDSTDGGHQNHLRFAHGLFWSTKDIQDHLRAVPTYQKLEGCAKCEFRHPDKGVVNRHRELFECKAWMREEAHRIRERERRAHLQERAHTRRMELRKQESQQIRPLRPALLPSPPPPPPTPPPGFKVEHARPFAERARQATALLMPAPVPLMSIRPSYVPQPTWQRESPSPPITYEPMSTTPAQSPSTLSPTQRMVTRPNTPPPTTPTVGGPSMAAILNRAAADVGNEEATVDQLQLVMANLRKAELALNEKARVNRVTKMSPIEQWRTLQAAPFDAKMVGLVIQLYSDRPCTVHYRAFVSQKLVPGSYMLRSPEGQCCRMRFGLFALHNACVEPTYRECWERQFPVIIDFLVVSENSGRRELFGSAQLNELPPEGLLDVFQIKKNKTASSPDAIIAFTALGLHPW